MVLQSHASTLTFACETRFSYNIISTACVVDEITVTEKSYYFCEILCKKKNLVTTYVE